MGKLKELRRQTLLEKGAAERVQAGFREEALLQAITKLRAAVLAFATGENWALGAKHFWINKRIPQKIIWLGEGNPQYLADKTMVDVFGKDYRQQVVKKEGKLIQL